MFKPASRGKIWISHHLAPYALTVSAGLMMSLAAAPLNLWPLAWVSLAPLWFWVTQANLKLRSRLCHAILWGLAYHGFTLSWLFHLHPLTWMGIPWLTSVLITLACWFVITLWGTSFVALWAIALWVYEQVFAPTPIPPWLGIGLRVLLGTTLWCVLEIWRNLTPLDWTPLGFTQSPGNLVILQLSQLSGPFTVSAVIAAVNGCLAESRRWNVTQNRRSRLGYGITLGLFLFCHLVGFSIGQFSPIQRSNVTEPPVKIGIIQGNIPTREKLFERGLQMAHDHYIQGYEKLADQGVQMVLTPEGALPIRWQTQHPLARAILNAIRDRQVPLILGTFMPTQGQSSQSLITLMGDGSVTSRYNKIRLVLFGEYIPVWMRGWIRRLSPMMGSLVPGKTNQVFQTPVGQAAVGICYESVFSELLRSQMVSGSTFILIASNLDPYSTTLMAQIHAHDVMRAIESDRDLVRVTNTGFSGLIQANGQTQWLSQPNTFAVQAVTLQPRQTQTLYLHWGNWFTPLLGCISTAIISVFSIRQQCISASSRY